jgi:hypothetical protein
VGLVQELRLSFLGSGCFGMRSSVRNAVSRRASYSMLKRGRAKLGRVTSYRAPKREARPGGDRQRARRAARSQFPSFPRKSCHSHPDVFLIKITPLPPFPSRFHPQKSLFNLLSPNPSPVNPTECSSATRDERQRDRVILHYVSRNSSDPFSSVAASGSVDSGADLCGAEGLKNIWRFEKYLKDGFKTKKKGLSWRPNFCPIKKELGGDFRLRK